MSLAWTTGHVLDPRNDTCGGDRLRQIDDHRHTLRVDSTVLEWHIPDSVYFSSEDVVECERPEIPWVTSQAKIWSGHGQAFLVEDRSDRVPVGPESRGTLLGGLW